MTVVVSVLYKTYSDPIGFTPVDIHRILRLSVRRSLTWEQRANLSGGGVPTFFIFQKDTSGPGQNTFPDRNPTGQK